jgi:NADH:ubiquinone oxidoreductase subunit 5 (subunit L)/multisubunit Na+/H+ antiporter MnhA subunit
MSLADLLQLFIAIPIVGFVLSIFIPHKRETALSNLAFLTAISHLIFFLVFVVLWYQNGSVALNIKEVSIFRTPHYDFFIDFYFDGVSAVFLFVGSFLTSLITVYSRYYLHREDGYKRFFNTILFFFMGYNIIAISGNLETMFIGWEVLGISSFLLIAFYRERYLPVKNALKVFSIYRIGDIGFILAMWASHHLWHENITFLKLNNDMIVNEHLASHSYIGFFIAFMLLVAAAAKSAQFPFTSWLPRAMEGPTPSSAIFYGSVSVHLGAFLLMRTFPFWEHQITARVMIGLVGLTTSIISFLIARVQSSIKAQVAYTSAGQIGLIFIELAFGLNTLALYHFAGNAFFRTYQLLVSPSVVSYKIKEQFFNYTPRVETFEDTWPKKIEYTFYLLSLKEWNLDKFMDWLIWKPLKNTGKKLDFINIYSIYTVMVPLFLIGLVFIFILGKNEHTTQFFPTLFSAIGALMVFKAFSERNSPLLAWLTIIGSHFWIILAISFNDKIGINEVYYYLTGIVIAGFIGFFILKALKSHESELNLNQFWGHSFKYPKMATAFLICCLGLMGFPISTTFIGIDLVFSHIESSQLFLAFATSLSYVVGGIAIVRIYARLFLGPHTNKNHSTPIKAS